MGDEARLLDCVCFGLVMDERCEDKRGGINPGGRKVGVLDSSQVVYRRSFLFRGLSNITFGRERVFFLEED